MHYGTVKAAYRHTICTKRTHVHITFAHETCGTYIRPQRSVISMHSYALIKMMLIWINARAWVCVCACISLCKLVFMLLTRLKEKRVWRPRSVCLLYTLFCVSVSNAMRSVERHENTIKLQLSTFFALCVFLFTSCFFVCSYFFSCTIRCDMCG